MADYIIPGELLYKNLVLQANMPLQTVEEICDMETMEGDVMVVSYPRTGTTWTLSMTWLICNDCDITTANQHPNQVRSKFLEFGDDKHYGDGNTGYDLVKNRDSPEVMKSHLPAWAFSKQLTDGKAKFLVVIRNPKDALVSLYHFYQSNKKLGGFPGSWDDFFELYKSKHTLYGNYFDWYKSWLPYLSLKQVKMIAYEDMKADIAGVITDVAQFLGKELSEDQKESIAQHVRFDNMKENKMSNPALFSDHFTKTGAAFMRKGAVGDWKNYFSPEQERYVENEYEELLKKHGIHLRFE